MIKQIFPSFLTARKKLIPHPQNRQIYTIPGSLFLIAADHLTGIIALFIRDHRMLRHRAVIEAARKPSEGAGLTGINQLAAADKSRKLPSLFHERGINIRPV